MATTAKSIKTVNLAAVLQSRQSKKSDLSSPLASGPTQSQSQQLAHSERGSLKRQVSRGRTVEKLPEGAALGLSPLAQSAPIHSSNDDGSDDKTAIRKKNEDTDLGFEGVPLGPGSTALGLRSITASGNSTNEKSSSNSRQQSQSQSHSQPLAHTNSSSTQKMNFLLPTRFASFMEQPVTEHNPLVAELQQQQPQFRKLSHESLSSAASASNPMFLRAKSKGNIVAAVAAAAMDDDMEAQAEQTTPEAISPSRTLNATRSQHVSEASTPTSPILTNQYPERGDSATRAPFERLQSDIIAASTVNKCEAFPLSKDEVNAHEFVKVKLIGKGAIGKVYLVKLKSDTSNNPRLYAVKVITKDEMLKKNKVRRVMTEREILATVNHPYVVGLYASFQTSTRLYFIMDYMAGGEFFKMLQAQPGKRLPEDAVRFYAAEVTLALQYLHHLGFIYRDLKPENVLVRQDGHIALADFDLSKQGTSVAPKVTEKKLSLTERLKGSFALKKSNSKMDQLSIKSSEPVLAGDCRSFVGTEEYLAPEVVQGTNQTGAVDWWTLGIFIYEMLYGATPFKGEEQAQTFQNILNSELKFPADDPAYPVSKDAKDLIKRLLTREVAKRMGSESGADEIREHKFFSSLNFALIRDMNPPILPVVRDYSPWSAYTQTLAEMDAKEMEAIKTNSSEAMPGRQDPASSSNGEMHMSTSSVSSNPDPSSKGSPNNTSDEFKDFDTYSTHTRAY